MLKLPMITALLLLSPALTNAQPAKLTGDLPRREARPLQSFAGLETEYGMVRTTEGLRLRTILTRPSGSVGKLPAILLTQWVSCGSIDVAADKPGLLQDLAQQSKAVLIRVDRAGTGDSEGPGCNALDYDTEVRHYREVLQALKSHAWVNPKQMVIFGSSLGATTAPLVADGNDVAGIVVQGGGAVTYLERMINFDRLNLERSGQFRPEQIHEEMLKRIRFHVAYLLDKKTPDAVMREQPDLAGIWSRILGGADTAHYGRPYSWHWQAANKDFLEAWTRIKAPVLVVYGNFDQFEFRHGHELIADTVNALRPGTAEFLALEKADHDLDFYVTAADAYAYRNPKVDRAAFLQPFLRWFSAATRAVRKTETSMLQELSTSTKADQ